MTKKAKEQGLKEKANELAKNIWFAGLGICSKAIDESQAQYEKANKEMTRLYHELVKKGKKVEGDLNKKISETKEKTTATREKQVARVKHGLEKTKGSKLDSKIEAVSEKLDLVIHTLETKKKAA